MRFQTSQHQQKSPGELWRFVRGEGESYVKINSIRIVGHRQGLDSQTFNGRRFLR